MKPPAMPLIVAHRGASREAPENTLAAFRLAWKQGAEAIEGDFRLTDDHQVVCIHDPDTARVANRTLTVNRSTLAALRELDVSAKHESAVAESAIPTIAEVLSTVPATGTIYIEVKCGPEIIPPMVSEIRKSGIQHDQVVIIAFHQDVIRQVKRLSQPFKALWLCSFKRNRWGNLSPSRQTVLEALEYTAADGCSSSRHIPDDTVAAIVEHGYEWHVWTVDDPATARRLIERGARSITTNVPGYLKTMLALGGAAHH